jgi:putative membrane protein
MRLTYFASTVVAIAIGTAVSAQDRQPSSPSDRTGAATASPQTTGPRGTRTFINDMAVAGLAEVELGKLASERAADADVKMFGQMMVTDHTKAGDELTQLATRAGVQPPKQLDAKHQQLVDKLSKLRGAEFDREYVSAMVMGHEEVAGMLRAQARGAEQTTSAQPSTGAAAGTSGSARTEAGSPGTANRPSPAAGAVGAGGATSADATVAQWAAKTLPTVQQHLERARALQQRTAR